MKKNIGLFRVMTFEELNMTANLLNKFNPKDAYDILDENLSKDIEGETFRRKAINNLTNTWGNGQKPLTSFQKKVLEVYSESSDQEKLTLQVLMMYYSFSFFADTTEIIGNYIRMKSDFQSKNIINEIRNIYGIRETVNKGVLSVIGTLTNWGFLDKETKGRYSVSNKRIYLGNKFGKNLLVLAILTHSEKEYITLESINSTSRFFMLDYQIDEKDIIFDNLEIIRDRNDIFIKMTSN